jgi:hypothetical protein
MNVTSNAAQAAPKSVGKSYSRLNLTEALQTSV